LRAREPRGAAARKSPSGGAILLLMGTLLLVVVLVAAALVEEVDRVIDTPTRVGVCKVQAAGQSGTVGIETGGVVRNICKAS
jgi:hypothetical protein